jgi:hypothetical protein
MRRRYSLAASNITRLKLADSSNSRPIDSRANKLPPLALLDKAEAVIHEGGYIVQELASRLDGKLEQSFGPQGATSILVFPL